MAFSSSDLTRLMTLLAEKAERISAYLALTKEQAVILAAEDVDADALQQSLDKRQGVIEAVNSLSAELDAAYGEYTQNADMIDRKDKLAVEELIKKTDRDIIEAGELDKANIAKAESAMKFFSGEAKRLNINRKGIGLYNQMAKMSGSEFFDRKS